MADASPVYLIVQLDITDMETFFAEYVGPTSAINQKYGVEVLVATPEVCVLEGSYSKNFTVVLKFPSAAVQKSWYSDSDYQRLKAIRATSTNADNSTLVVASQFVPQQ